MKTKREVFVKKKLSLQYASGQISRRVLGDKNCLFRAISLFISNTRTNHTRLRQLTFDHISRNGPNLQSFLREDYRDIDSYLKESKTQEGGTWGTEFEISALVHMMNWSF